MFIPFNINRISRGAFDECTGLENIYYEGDEFLWREEISVKEYNDAIKPKLIRPFTVFAPMEVIDAPKITVSEPAVGEDGKSEVEVVVPALEKNYANAVVYAVTEDGAVSKTDLVNGGETKLTVPADGADTVKVFIWSKSMQPITTVFEKPIQ